MHVMHGQKPAAYGPRPEEMRYRYLLGVKWSQVQILSARPMSARPKSPQVWGGFGQIQNRVGCVSGASYANAYANQDPGIREDADRDPGRGCRNTR